MVEQAHTRHIPVLLDEVIELLQPVPTDNNCLLLDCTLGGGGHAEAFLSTFPKVFLIGIDRDRAAIARVRGRLAPFAERFGLLCGNFADVLELLSELPENASEQFEQNSRYFDRILVDLGLSSDQLDDQERGFSFRGEASLDMRMDLSQQKTAEQVVNEYSLSELRRVFLRGGLGQPSSKLAKKIVAHRPVETAEELAAICKRVLQPFGKHSGSHPATVPFQALRIEVNDELGSIERFLDSVLEVLAPGGRLAVISFHSLEDRLITKRMRSWTRSDAALLKLPLPGQASGKGTLLTTSALVPGSEEIERNPRARSARMRVFERNAAPLQ